MVYNYILYFTFNYFNLKSLIKMYTQIKYNYTDECNQHITDEGDTL